MPIDSSPYRNATLDVLRGVAVGMVILFHAWGMAIEHGPPSLRAVSLVCWAGVDLFFVLSGFLIGGLLLREIDKSGTIALGRFWLRRGFKIWPSYYVAYGFMLLVRGAHHVRTRAWDKLDTELSETPRNAFFVQNYFPVDTHWPNSWSLAVEEHFYLALPLVLLALLRMLGPGRLALGVSVLGAAVAVLALGLRLWASRGPDPNTYFPTHFRMDSLMAGVTLSVLAGHRPAIFQAIARRWRLALVLAPLALLAMIPLRSPWPLREFHGDPLWNAFTIGFTLLWLGFTPLVAAAAANPTATERAPAPLRLPMRVLAWLGTYSYTIYLGQAIVPDTPGFPTVVGLVARFVDSPATQPLVFVALSIAVGVALSHVVERPLLRRRERVLPASATSSSTAETPAPVRQAS